MEIVCCFRGNPDWCWLSCWRVFYRCRYLAAKNGSIWRLKITPRISALPAPRGIIYDRNGYILARNVASYNVTITPAYLPDDDADIQRIYRAVSDLTGIPVGGPVTADSLNAAKLFAPCVEGPSVSDLVALGESLAPYSPVEIKCNVSEDVARLVQEHSADWPGVNVEILPIRDYPTGSLTADMIGYLGPIPALLEPELVAKGFVPNRDKVGYAGIELSLQDILTGQNGKRVIQVDVAGQELAESGTSHRGGTGL